MSHPYQQYREKHPGQKKARGRIGKRADGGSVSWDGDSGRAMLEDRAQAPKIARAKKEIQTKATGGPVKGRLDKYARGGKAKGKKSGSTHINIVVAPKSGEPPAAGLPPPGIGAAAPPPMPPKMPLGPPPGGPMGGPPMGGPPGAGMPPMKRGGKVKTKGGDNGVGRLDKAKAYGAKPKGK